MVIIAVDYALLEDIYFCRIKRGEPAKTGQVYDFLTGFPDYLQGIGQGVEIPRLHLTQ